MQRNTTDKFIKLLLISSVMIHLKLDRFQIKGPALHIKWHLMAAKRTVENVDIILHFSDVFSHDLTPAVISAWKTASVRNMVAQHGRLVTRSLCKQAQKHTQSHSAGLKLILRIFRLRHLDSEANNQLTN